MSAEERNRSDLKNTVYDINKEAARYYHYLLETETGNNARAYFNKRELSMIQLNLLDLVFQG